MPEHRWNGPAYLLSVSYRKGIRRQRAFDQVSLLKVKRGPRLGCHLILIDSHDAKGSGRIVESRVG